jgi:hypothetical protein
MLLLGHDSMVNDAPITDNDNMTPADSISKFMLADGSQARPQKNNWVLIPTLQFKNNKMLCSSFLLSIWLIRSSVVLFLDYAPLAHDCSSGEEG